MKLKHNYEPWEYMEIEDFLPQKRFKELQDQAKVQLENYKKQGSNTPRGKYICYSGEDMIPEFNPIFDLLPRRQPTGKLKKINHWAVTPPGVHYPTHIDNKSRFSTIAFYVSPEKNSGTIICKNPSTNDDGDHCSPDLPSETEVEIEWKPNKIFLHCGGPVKWHRYYGNENYGHRIIISAFLVQPDLINKGRIDLDYLIDI